MGLYGRTEFENFLQSAISSPGEHTLLFIDVDQFKVINDTCGHAAGDECLRQISAIFKAHINKQDMLRVWVGMSLVLCFAIRINLPVRKALSVYDVLSKVIISNGYNAFSRPLSVLA